MVPKRILVVDHNEPMLKVLKSSIELVFPGYEVIAADTGIMALASLQEKSVDLILTDYDIPGLNGLDLAQLVHHFFPQIPIILMSANHNQAEIQQKAALVDDLIGFLGKPFSMWQLTEILQKTGIQ